MEPIKSSWGRIFGHLTDLFVVLKGIPFTYNKDMQADKIPLKQGIEETKRVLLIFDLVIRNIKPAVNDKMKSGINYLLMATDLVDYLVNKELPFRETHGFVSEIIRYVESKGEKLNSLPLSELKKFNTVFEQDVYDLFDPWASIEYKKTSTSTHPEEVKKQLKLAKNLLE